jgi:hypothetical protein
LDGILGAMASHNSKERLLPTGQCWCGCGAELPVGSFFAPGHDKVAESAVILTQFGGVPEFLREFGFGPDGLNPSQELAKWRSKGNRSR